MVQTQNFGAPSRGKGYFMPLDGREMRFGYTTSWETLALLGITFSELRSLASRSNLPIGEIGSAFSTLPYEALAQRLNWQTVDPLYAPDHSLAILVEALLGNLGSTDPAFASWYKHYGRAAKDVVTQRHIPYRLEDLPQEKLWAATIVTNALPKYSDRWRFLNTQLPALLQRTASVAYVYPLSVWSPLPGDATHQLVCTDRLYADPGYLELLSEVAASYGFDLHLHTPTALVTEHSPIVALRQFMPGLSVDFLDECDQPAIAVFRHQDS